MKTIALAILALTFSLSAFADDLVLKDGKRVAWKTITDMGKEYKIETPDGKELTFKKSQVERITVGAQVNSQPLTGAAFAMDPKKVVTVDLLPKAMTEATKGAWKSMPGVLTYTGDVPGRAAVSFDYEVPEEYDLTVRIERTAAGVADFDIGVLQGESVGAYCFDAFGAVGSVFAMIDGKFSAGVEGQVFLPKKPKTVRISVRKDAIQVQVDGKEHWKSRMDWSSVTLQGDRPKPEAGKFYLTTMGGPWKVTAFTVTHLK